MKGKLRKIFMAHNVLEEWLEAVARQCNCHLGVEVSAVKM